MGAWACLSIDLDQTVTTSSAPRRQGHEPVLARLKPRALDPPLEHALTSLRQVQDSVDVDGATRFTRVSVSRLRTIARKELGVTLSGWLMWRKLDRACAAQNGPETRGQILRLVAAIPGYVFGWVPVGNTGGANVSAVKPLPVPPNLAPYFKGYSTSSGVLVRVGIAAIALIGRLFVTTA